VIKFNIPCTSYENVLHAFAQQQSVTVHNNQMTFPSVIGRGFVRALDIEEGLSVIIADVHLKQDLCVERLPTSCDEYFVLHFNELRSGDPMKMKVVEEDVEGEEKEIYAGVSLMRSTESASFVISSGAHLRSVDMLINLNWLKKFLGAELNQKLFTPECGTGQMPRLQGELLDTDYRVLLNEMLQEQIDHPLKTLYILNRVQLLVERFFTRYYHRDGNAFFGKQVSHEEMQRVQKVEQVLVNTVSETVPTIDKLAKMAAMSSTKLKSLFKTAYGMPIYEYYQQNRMRIARQMLMTRKHTIKEVGQRVGYHNISHFAAAFKKVHRVLPSEVNR